MASPPPQLPPRQSPHLGCLSHDPRTSSTQSLLPTPADVDAAHEPRRTLLLVYIHGFYGNDESFRSFPAHVHGLVRTLLADSHVIHSKIYPRYKTYRAIQVARDRFSAWLEPHQSPSTDVILVGHSMGGLLAAEVALIPNHDAQRQQPFKHAILGTISLDSPFLGLHPGIVVSGISSLFQPAQKPAKQAPGSAPLPTEPDASASSFSSSRSQLELTLSSSSSPPARRDSDPYFDPPYWNDEPFREQPWMKRILHFTSKHYAEGILHAMRNHVASHLEFGGCLADYPGLISRYNKLRALEDVDDLKAEPIQCRVRFVNYYTLSPGRPKQKVECKADGRPSSRNDDDRAQCQIDITAGQDVALQVRPDMQSRAESTVSIPTVSIDTLVDTLDEEAEEQLQDEKARHGEHEIKTDKRDESISTPLVLLEAVEPMPMEEYQGSPLPLSARQETSRANLDELDLPAVPEEPRKPEMPNLESITDKAARKQAEREGKRAQKAYDRAVKDRAKALCERQRLVDKRRKQAQKKAAAVEAAAKVKASADSASASAASADLHSGRSRKLGKFCALPCRINGVRDAAWVPVFLDDMDQVAAHCGLFLPGPHYEMLVGDVGSRIAAWVQEDLSTKAIVDLD